MKHFYYINKNSPENDLLVEKENKLIKNIKRLLVGKMSKPSNKTYTSYSYFDNKRFAKSRKLDRAKSADESPESFLKSALKPTDEVRTRFLSRDWVLNKEQNGPSVRAMSEKNIQVRYLRSIRSNDRFETAIDIQSNPPTLSRYKRHYV